MRFFSDFEALDREQLHLRTFLPIREYALKDDGLYHQRYLESLDSIEFDQHVTFR